MAADEFTEFHDELRSVAGDLLAKDREVGWAMLVDAGWTGLEVPDALGGAGATFGETAVILEQIGRASSANSYLGSAVLAGGLLNLLQDSQIRDELFTTVADGPSRLCAVAGDFVIDDGRVSGRAEFVADAVGADRLLLITATGVAVVPPTGLTVQAQPVVDETRRLAAVTADAVEIDQVLEFAGDPAAATQAFHDRAAVAIACDSLGVAAQMLTATVDYLKVRHQFGRPIGSFQAVKHACADMLVAVEVSRQLVAEAVGAVSDNADAGVAAAMAKSYTCLAAVDVAGKAMQLHGGIGYTWESGIHIYLKRAALNRSLFGSPAAQRQKLAQRYR
ncbi:Caffeyl-CoA reductase-Etf complex subunit CarC [Mycolicibacterium vanbaalenii]|uniref:Caffeyl-CoA reductase-Etf complex subunit CarC n=1 Tax=Mycolicibacterium vanbaalenii TaxID=110539 RepID=A0A5S9Q8W5_MYCVN|nr:acyl-CoA dehydrogenase family protein [Mycolicibacterium vanbaalenii]CAA0114443.1 Caffeyl-CoA reductase-Etf complex subunit CarC [Mycolicibacterium vanbaalenii]